MHLNNRIKFSNWFTTILLLVRNFKSAENALEFEITQNPLENVTNCLINLSTMQRNSNTVIIIDYQEILFNMREIKIIITGDTTVDIKLLSKETVFNKVVMLVDSVDSFKKWLHKLKLLSSWNPRGKYIVLIMFVLPKDIKNMFEIAWEKYVLDIEVITMNCIYTYYPYNSSDCLPNFHPYLVSACDEITAEKIVGYKDKIPQKFGNCPVRLMPYVLPPYVMEMKSSADKSNPKIVGAETVLIDNIAKYLQLKPIYIDHSFSNWGQRLSNRSYTNMYNYTHNKLSDIMFGMVPLDETFFDDFENTDFYFHDQIIWWVPSAKQIPKWIYAMTIYQPIVWVLIFSTLISYSVIWYGIGKKEERNYYYNSCTGSCLGAWQVMLQMAIPGPKGNAIRVLYLFWCIFSLLLYTAHQSNLISALSKLKYATQITDVTQLLESKLKYGFPNPMKRFFNDTKDWKQVKIRNNFIDCPLTEECVNRTAYKGDFAVLKNRMQVLHSMKRYYLTEKGKPLLYPFKDGILALPHLAVSKGYPLFSRLNEAIRRMQSSGLTQKWIQEVEFKKKYQENIEPMPLSLETYLMSFLTLGIMHVFGIIVFICELLYKYCKSAQ